MDDTIDTTDTTDTTDMTDTTDTSRAERTSDPSRGSAVSFSDIPDLMNDPAFAPPQRRDTASSMKSGTDGDAGGDTCRICRSEGSPDEPLFYPCKCSGSIKFVHQECLMEWLSHSHKKHCELCKTPFRFTKLYDADMPTTLPWTVFIQRAFIHVAMMFSSGLRALVVISVWLLFLPLMIRWAWRWMFWFADAGWARELYIKRMQVADVNAAKAQHSGTELVHDVSAGLQTALYDAYDRWFGSVDWKSTFMQSTTNATATAPSTIRNATATINIYNTTSYWPQADASVLSSWTHLSEITPSPKINRVILDVFEGQLITCVVILGFILVFLIREWVVQQQPLVNLDQLQNERREQERRIQERDRLRRQAELVEEARERLAALQNERVARLRRMQDEDGGASSTNANRAPDIIEIGWDEVYVLIDSATQELSLGGGGREAFMIKASEVMCEILAAESSGADASTLADKVYSKLSELSNEQREAWEEVLLAELEARGARKPGRGASSRESQAAVAESSTAPRRPRMPARAQSSAATVINRVLEEEEVDPDRTARGEAADANPSLDEAAFSASRAENQAVPRGPRPISTARLLEANPAVKTQVLNEPVPSHNDASATGLETMPITNAGPDAKVNIKRKGTGKARIIVPEPDEEEPAHIIAANELNRLLAKKVASSDAKVPEGTSREEPGANEQEATDLTVYQSRHESESSGPPSDSRVNPFHPDGPMPDSSRSVSNDDIAATSGVNHEETNEEEDQARQAEMGYEAAEATEHDSDVADLAIPTPQRVVPPAGPANWLIDWFWGDIQPQNHSEPIPAAPEERIDPHDPQEAPLVPVQDGAQFIDQEMDDGEPQGAPDPEVLAAAQQVGLDAEAIEDAEDLEGIVELIGLQGPIIGLFQTSCFCSVLVISSVFCAIGVPYMWGKLVLVFINSPVESLIKTPLRFISLFTDFLVDVALLVIGWLATAAIKLVETVTSSVEAFVPWLGDAELTSWCYKISKATAVGAYHRLSSLFPSATDTSADTAGMQWAWLHVSVEAHASLRTIQHESSVVLNYTGSVITSIVECVSSGSATVICHSLLAAVKHIAGNVVRACASLESVKEYVSQWWKTISGMRSGWLLNLSSANSSVAFDPALVYWNSNDRGLAVLAGYVALAMLAAIYVALDTPITSSESHQKTEKVIRDSLRQAGGVLKVILIISIEMLVFPLYCGLLLDIAFLPLQDGASLATRWAYATQAPYTFCFIHWFVGTCYMFHFALFVGMCRKILRKGTLWFIRDPDDPTFHPVRDVLERNVTTQLRKIAFSALVYGALVILCLGGVIWSIGRLFQGIFPIHWVATEPYVEFSVDLLLYTSLTPTLLNLAKPSTIVHAMYAWWLRRCARALRLSHFLFGDRKKDEEGRHVRGTWSSFFLMKTAKLDQATGLILVDNEERPEVFFQRDGKYVLTPCNDQYRPPKPGEAFIHVENNDVYIADKNGKKNDHFARIYTPPNFRLRMTFFMVSLWMFSAFIGLCATLVPLCFGRQVLVMVLPAGVVVNDIYAYSIGAYFFGGLLFLALKGGAGAQYLRQRATEVDFKAWAAAAAKTTLQALKCLYVYGFACVVMPLVFVTTLHFYFLIPLHTYLASSIRPALLDAMNPDAANSTLTAVVNATMQSFSQQGSNFTQASSRSTMPSVAEHSIHVLADGALGMLIGKIVVRGILLAPSSRAAEACRRITADGYLNPNARLATRFIIVPATLLSSVVLLGPLGLANMILSFVTWLGPRMASNFEGITEEVQVLVHRYSYPVTAAWALSLWGTGQMAKATGRWRARIRDEVYLVGERLHNFGEKKPPPGTKGVVRRAR